MFGLSTHMKKLLLTLYFSIVSSVFFVNAQTVNLQIAPICTTNSSGQKLCVNPQTNQWQLVDSKGRGVNANLTTGQYGVTGTIDGNKIGIGGNLYGTQQRTSLTSRTNLGGIQDLLFQISNILAMLSPILVALALVTFFFFLVLFIKESGNPEVQKKMKLGIMWSIVALFVMISIWGILSLMGDLLGIDKSNTINGFRLPGKSAQ